MDKSLNRAISAAIQAWLLNNEPTPAAKALAQSLNILDAKPVTGAVAVLLTHPGTVIEAAVLDCQIDMLTSCVDWALTTISKESTPNAA